MPWNPTMEAILQRKNGSYADLCRILGVPDADTGRVVALFSRILTGKPVSLAAENRVRRWLDLELLPEPRFCRYHGVYHTYDCTQQRVVRKRPDPPAWVSETADWLHERQRRRQVDGRRQMVYSRRWWQLKLRSM